VLIYSVLTCDIIGNSDVAKSMIVSWSIIENREI